MEMASTHGFETWAGGLIQDPVDMELEPDMVEENTQCDPAKSGQKPGCNPLIFFIIKMTSF